MTVAYANPQDASLKKFLAYSATLHGLLALSIAFSAYLQYRGTQWSGTGGSAGDVRVGLVSSAGIPMPKEPVVTESKAVDLTKGVYKEEEKPKPPEPPKVAEKIPEWKKEKPLPPSHKSKVDEIKTPPPDNAVPYGKGGNPNLPTGYSQTPGPASSGVTMQGQGGGDFATRYGWYIEAARRRVGPNWNVLMLDPAVRNSTTLHCVIAFTLTRDGSIKNLRIAQSSGNSSWDYSGLRAIQSSAPFPPLPSDWGGGDVAVLWDFPERDNP